MKCGGIDMFLFLFIFVTKMSFCFHTIEIKSCKKNLHKEFPHDPTSQSAPGRSTLPQSEKQKQVTRNLHSYQAGPG